jgi:hypothetical protein
MFVLVIILAISALVVLLNPATVRGQQNPSSPPAYHFPVGKGHWAEYNVTKAVNCQWDSYDYGTNTTRTYSLHEGDRLRVDVVNVYEYAFGVSYANGTEAMTVENYLESNMSLNGEVLPYPYSSYGFYIPWQSFVPLWATLTFHPAGGNDYWSTYKAWVEDTSNQSSTPNRLNMVIGASSVSISQQYYDPSNASNVYNDYSSVVCKYTGVPMETWETTDSGWESHLELVATNIPIGNAPPTEVSLSTPVQSEIGNTSIVLRWVVSPDADFARYEIYRSRYDWEPATLVTAINNKTGTTYNVTGLSPGTNYYFSIRVYDAVGLYAPSNKVHVKTALSREYSPGVSAGMYVKYGNFTGVGPNSEYVNDYDWLRNEVFAVSGKEVTLQTYGQFKNGSSISGTSSWIFNVESGEVNGTTLGLPFVIAANLNEGDVVPSIGTFAVNKTETRMYVGVSRTVNILNWTQSALGYSFSQAYTFDRASGMLLELDMIQTTPDSTTKFSFSVVETNIFSVPAPTPTPTPPPSQSTSTTASSTPAPTSAPAPWPTSSPAPEPTGSPTPTPSTPPGSEEPPTTMYIAAGIIGSVAAIAVLIILLKIRK